MFIIELPTIQKHLATHLDRVGALRFRGVGPIGTPAELVDKEQRFRSMNTEMHYFLNNSPRVQKNSFEPFYERMMRDAVSMGWQPPEDRLIRFSRLNPCGEIPLGTPQFTVLDGQHRLAALRAMGMMGMGGAPYPLHIHNTQHRHLCRELWKIAYPVHRDTPIVLMLGVRELNGKKAHQLIQTAANPLVVQLVYGFYNQTRSLQWWSWIRQMCNQFITKESREEYARIAGNLIQDAVGLGKDAAFKKEWRTNTVMGLLRDMRTRDDYSTFPILADALEEAGFDYPKILENYRDPMANHSGGSWIFRKAGLS